MLEESAVERLSPDGVVEEGYESAGLRGQRPKLLTYFQLCLKPHVDVRSRGCRELAVTRSLDLLREGRLTELGRCFGRASDGGRYSSRQGWNTAKHLEVCCEEDEGVAPSHVLLAAQRHARQVEKAGGKGSWPRSGGWGSSDLGAGDKRQGAKPRMQRARQRKEKANQKEEKPIRALGKAKEETRRGRSPRKGEGRDVEALKLGLCKVPLPCSHPAVWVAYSCMDKARGSPGFRG